MKTNIKAAFNQALIFREALLSPAAPESIDIEIVNVPYLVRQVSYLYARLVNAVELINKCYAIQVSCLLSNIAAK